MNARPAVYETAGQGLFLGRFEVPRTIPDLAALAAAFLALARDPAADHGALLSLGTCVLALARRIEALGGDGAVAVIEARALAAGGAR